MTLICSQCDAEGDGTLDALPAGWIVRHSPALGTLAVCPVCASKAPPQSGRAIALAVQNDDVIPTAAQGRLRAIIERVERLEEDEDVIRNDKREVYAEAKGEGFDVKILKRVVRARKLDPAKREEEQAIYDLYAGAIGMA